MKRRFSISIVKFLLSIKWGTVFRGTKMLNAGNQSKIRPHLPQFKGKYSSTLQAQEDKLNFLRRFTLISLGLSIVLIVASWQVMRSCSCTKAQAFNCVKWSNGLTYFSFGDQSSYFLRSTFSFKYLSQIIAFAWPLEWFENSR